MFQGGTGASAENAHYFINLENKNPISNAMSAP
jgi:hypothetical protein